jgi:hypothetical protein
MPHRFRRTVMAVSSVAAVGAAMLAGGLPARAASASSTSTVPTVNRARWEYLGFPGDAQKSLAFIGGELSAGGGQPQPQALSLRGAVTKPIIQYYLSEGSTIYGPDENESDLASSIHWSLADGYLPSPISTWQAGPVSVTIQHAANRIDHGAATAVYTQVTLSNTSRSPVSMRLNVTASPATEVPLHANVSGSTDSSEYFDLRVSGGRSVHRDFVTLGDGDVGTAQLKRSGGFAANFAAMARYWNKRLAAIALPTSLPTPKPGTKQPAGHDPSLVDAYKAAQIEQWENENDSGHWGTTAAARKGPVIWGSAGNESGLYPYSYDFGHDEPDIVSQLVRAGDYTTANAILQSPEYWSYVSGLPTVIQNYLDGVGKWIEPFYLYEQDARDPSALFTATIKSRIKWTAHEIADLRNTDPSDPHYGLMQASNTLDNGSDYLMVDDLASEFGLQAYANLATTWGGAWKAEAQWARSEAQSINSALNNYLTKYTIPRLGGFYSDCLDACSKASVNAYNGNWLGTMFAMSGMPWDGSLAGSNLGGTWREYLDASVLAAFRLRASTADGYIPEHSWGAWSNNASGYGTIYNAGMGEQLLASSNMYLRYEPIADVEWLMDNQSAPIQWGESFAAPPATGSWTAPEADYETWGLAQFNRTLLESSISVAADGSRIIGRGIPNSWITSGTPITWNNVPVGGDATAGFTIRLLKGSRVSLSLRGNVSRPTQFELPLFVNNIVKVSTGQYNGQAGSVSLRPGQRSVSVTVRDFPPPPANPYPVLSPPVSSAGAFTFGAIGDQNSRAQTFVAAATTVSSAQVAIRDRAITGTGQTDVTAGLFAVRSNDYPTGQALATATVPASQVSPELRWVTMPISYSHLTKGQTYAIVLGQETPNSSVYEWGWDSSGPSIEKYNNLTNVWATDTEAGAALLVVKP